MTASSEQPAPAHTLARFVSRAEDMVDRFGPPVHRLADGATLDVDTVLDAFDVPSCQRDTVGTELAAAEWVAVRYGSASDRLLRDLEVTTCTVDVLGRAAASGVWLRASAMSYRNTEAYRLQAARHASLGGVHRHVAVVLGRGDHTLFGRDHNLLDFNLQRLGGVTLNTADRPAEPGSPLDRSLRVVTAITAVLPILSTHREA